MVKSTSWRQRRTVCSTLRRTIYSHVRRLDRPCIRNLPGFRPGPDDFSQALTAFTRAIRAHRRVARLLQIGFDFARLACGSYDPSADKSLSHEQALADLERAYGRPIPGEEISEETAAAPSPPVEDHVPRSDA